MAFDAFVTVLAFGALMIAVDGQILYRSGTRYLAAGEAGGAAGSPARLVTVLFHLAMFGALALLAVLDLSFGGGTLRAIVGNLGVLLLLLAVAHAVTMTALAAFAAPHPAPQAESGGRPRQRTPV